jgi:hypothetical protein
VIRAYATILLASVLTAAAAFADTRIGAKVQCQVEYGSGAELANACERGVDLAARTPEKIERALRACGGGDDASARTAACRRGVLLHVHVADRERDGDVARDQRARDRATSAFSYGWERGGGAQVELGDYQVRVGDAERSMEACMRAFEGSATPPSCLSGVQVQRKPPLDPPRHPR